MDKSILTSLNQHNTIYHTATAELPYFYALTAEIASKYFEEDLATTKRVLNVYTPTKRLNLINIGRSQFVDDLLYQLLQGNYFYNEADRTLELLKALGLYSDRDIQFRTDEYVPIENKYNFKFPDCDNELVNNEVRLYFWKIAKIIMDTRRTIQRNSFKQLDYTIFAFLIEIYKPFNIDGFIHYFNIPSELACGFHHPEVYIHNPAVNIEKVNTIFGGGPFKNYYLVPFTTGNPEHDKKLPPRLKNALIPNYCPFYNKF